MRHVYDGKKYLKKEEVNVVEY